MMVDGLRATKHSEFGRRVANQDVHSPWKFKDMTMELEYQNASIDEMADRLRIPGAIYLAAAWMSRLPVFWHIYFEESAHRWTAELYMSLLRMANILVYTALYFTCQYVNQNMKRRIGYFLVWFMRIAIFPLNFAHEIGIGQCPTQIFMMQVQIAVIFKRSLSEFAIFLLKSGNRNILSGHTKSVSAVIGTLCASWFFTQPSV